MRVRIVELEGGLDPDEYVKEYGAEAYQRKVAEAKTYFYWLADRARARFNMRDPQGRVDAVRFLLPSIQVLNDALERATVVNDIASYLGIERGPVQDHFRKAAVDRVERPLAAPKIEPAKATDRILLPLLVSEAEGRAALIESLRNLPAWRQLRTAHIYEILIAMHDNREPIDFNSVHSRLAAAIQAIFEAIVLDAPVASLEDGIAAIEALRREERETQRRALKTRIKEAERQGKISEALQLTTELSLLG
jgi:DNA primase